MSMSNEYPPENTDTDISAETPAAADQPPEDTSADISADTPADQPRDADTTNVVTAVKSG